MALQIKARLIYNKRVKGNYFHCALSTPKIAKEARPGQFVNIKVTDNAECLLRRPFSIHKARGHDIEILYEVVGLATQILSGKKRGEYLDIIGPLGEGFNYGLPITDYRLRILIAGGMGVAPLIFLAEELAKRKAPASPAGRQSAKAGKTKVLIGAKTKSQILCEKEFQKLNCDVKIATDDGSQGFKGKVTDLLKSLLRITDYRLRPACRQAGITIYACGPRLMLKEVSRLSKKYNCPAQISLEEHMACGIGACFGCSVNTKEGFKRVCKEGPVFGADEIVWGNTR